MKKFVKYVNLDLFYVHYSGSFDMHIEKLKKKNFCSSKVSKNRNVYLLLTCIDA